VEALIDKIRANIAGINALCALASTHRPGVLGKVGGIEGCLPRLAHEGKSSPA